MMKTGRVKVVAGFVLCLAAGAMLSAQAATEQTEMDKAIAKAAASTGDRAAEQKIALPETPGDVILGDAATKQKYLEAMQRYYEYRASGYAYRSRVFEWQLLSSRVIFLVVLALVGAGMYFAAVQFHAALVGVRASKKGAAAQAAATALPLATQFEVSAKGVVVNSSVLGIVILAVSLAFFYLYLVYVYPIVNVF
jgi:hypothetical protein